MKRNKENIILEKWIYINGEKTHYKIRSTGEVWNTVTNAPMKGGRDKNGYHIISLTLNKKKYTRKVHRLVAEAFIPNPENKPEVNHNDGDKLNNDISNLEWANPSENTHHACEHNLRKSTLTRNMVIEVCELLEKGDIRISEISKITGVSCGNILKIKTGLTWKSVSTLYDFSNYKFGRGLNGEKNNNSKIKEEDVVDICGLLAMGFRCSDIEEILGIPYDIIWNIKKRNTWKYISNNYKFRKGW